MAMMMMMVMMMVWFMCARVRVQYCRGARACTRAQRDECGCMCARVIVCVREEVLGGDWRELFGLRTGALAIFWSRKAASRLSDPTIIIIIIIIATEPPDRARVMETSSSSSFWT